MDVVIWPANYGGDCPRGPIHPLDHPMFWPWLQHESLAFLNKKATFYRISLFILILIDFEYSLQLPAETLIPDHKVSINIRRKNVWHLLLTTLVHGSTWEHMVASTGNQGFSMLTPVLKVFWSDFEAILGTWPHMSRQRQRNWMYRKERCRTLPQIFWNGRGLMDVDGIEDIVGHNNWVCLKIGDRTHPKSIGIQQ